MGRQGMDPRLTNQPNKPRPAAMPPPMGGRPNIGMPQPPPMPSPMPSPMMGGPINTGPSPAMLGGMNIGGGQVQGGGMNGMGIPQQNNDFNRPPREMELPFVLAGQNPANESHIGGGGTNLWNMYNRIAGMRRGNETSGVPTRRPMYG